MIDIKFMEIPNAVSYRDQMNQIHSENYLDQNGFLVDTDYLEKATHIFLAFEEKKVIGYLSIDINGYREEKDMEHTTFFTPIHFENNIYVKQFAIAKTHQNQGIGKKMLDALKEFGSSHQYTCIYLFMWSLNQKAHSFYTKNGFIHCGTWATSEYKGIKPFASYLFSYLL